MKIDPLFKQLATEKLLKTTIRAPSRLNLPPNSVRFALEQMSRVFPKSDQVSIRELKLTGLKVEEIKAQDEATQLILYIHGGAFFVGSLTTHRAYLTQMAARTQMQVLHVQYPLAPEYQFPDAIEALLRLYKDLLSQDIQSKDIILAGDCSGTNLALALALRIREEKLAQVSGLMLASPFLDLTLTSESIRYNAKLDAMLSPKALKTGIEYYVPRGYEHGDAKISPLFADLSGLPPLFIQVGSKALLLDDAKRLHQRAEAAGVQSSLKIYTGMWHNFQLFHAWFDEGQQALADLAEFAHSVDLD